MQKRIYACYDTKTKLFGNPFYAIRAEQALRDFAYAANDPSTEIHRYSMDFHLYFLGTYEDETGQISAVTPEHVATALSLQIEPETVEA